jgi:hypothetical protein
MSDAFYRSKEWRALRAEVLRRQPTCTTPGCGARAVAVDHIQPRAKGGPDTLANLRGLCIQHHNMRRRGGEPRLVGCDATGAPLDPGHWWHQSATDCGKNSTQLRVADRSGDTRKVSSGSRSDG